MTATGLKLAGESTIPWNGGGKASGAVSPMEVVLGRDPFGMGLQVVVAQWGLPQEPTLEAMRGLHAARQAKKVFPLVVAAVRGERAWLFGPAADSDVFPVALPQAERLLQAALDEPDGLAARTRLAGLQRAATTGQEVGVVNRGLFASHYLDTRVPQRPDWAPAAQRAERLLGLRHQALLDGLGFDVLPDGQGLLLSQQHDSRAVAVLLDTDEQFDADTSRLGVSPVAYGLRLASKRGVPWLILLRGSQIRLYPARPGVGVGQKGQADTWFEIDLAIVDDERSPMLPLVFSADALAPGGSTQQLLDGSAQFAVELGNRLRERVYDRVIPRLSEAVAARLPDLGVAVDAAGLDLAYRLTMRILFRLLFQAYAEDRDLLPIARSAAYRAHSLKQWAMGHAQHPDREFDAASTRMWQDLAQVWRVINDGDPDWGVPAYNGGLFADDPRHREGHLLARLLLDDATTGEVLTALLVDQTGSGGTGPVDFRSLSVREFGTLYEGLLESELSIAGTDLAIAQIKEKGRTRELYVPAKPGEPVAVPAGGVYFHSASGERKATGTYFTPHIVVEHLVQRALDPVLAEHLARVAALLNAGDQAGAAEAFFDFRVADLAMGSGHFLTAAVDHLEAAMRDFLTEHPIPAVLNELNNLERAADHALGPDGAAAADLDQAALLRRQIARRCIYGLDINPMAVDLARLAIWITTFVPGLPMSSLDHTLVAANSLTGVGTIGEALAVLDPTRSPNAPSFVTDDIEGALASARDLLVDAANRAEATKIDVSKGEAQAAAALAAAEPARLLFDAVVAGRLGILNPGQYFEPDRLQAAAADPRVQDAVRAVRPAHFPYLFPEVFLRDRPGFDVILGNPPWEKLKVEEHAWWAARFPGLRSLPQKEKNTAIAGYKEERPDLLAAFERDVAAAKAAKKLVGVGPFPGLTAGTDTDLMAAFAWRFTHVVAPSGAIGVVLPRTAFAGSALEQWRKTLLTSGDITDLTMLVNNRQWLFPEVHPQYTVALLAYRPGPLGGARTVALQGPYSSAEAFLDGTGGDWAGRFACGDVLGWTPTAAFPLLPDQRSLPVFAQMRTHPSLDDPDQLLGLRPFRELHTSDNKPMFDFDLGDPAAGKDLPVWTGGSFDLWNPDHGRPYAFASTAEVETYLLARRRKSAARADSVFAGLSEHVLRDPGTLDMHRARIAFRDVTNRTNNRTMVCCLIPPGVGVVEKAPYCARIGGDAEQEAYLLAVMSSRIFDWYARRFVELKMSYGLLNSFPIPRPGQESPLRRRGVEIAGRLAAVDGRYSAWAAEVGVPVGSVRSDTEKRELVRELDAVVALLYGLDEGQVRAVFETFHDKWDYREHLDGVLEQYAAWKGRAR